MVTRNPRAPQIGVAAIQPVFTALVERGADPAALCAAVGIDPSVVRDPDARIPLGRLDAVWNHAAALLRDPHLGLHLAESVGSETFGLLSYLGASCPTWGDGLRAVCRYFRLLSDASSYHLNIEGPWAVVTATQDAPSLDSVRQRVEFTIAVLHCYGRRLVDGDWRTGEIFLEHPPPPDELLCEHIRVFGRLPRFSAGASGFTFPASLLERPLRTSEPHLAAILERLASRLLADTAPCPSIAQLVRTDLARIGLHGDLTLDGVAGRLGMSPRTLQRRLRDEATSLSDLVDQVRRTMATHLLSAPETGIAEVAYAVGFSEPAAFHRAFKRWTGRTPAEFRRPADKAP